MESTGEKEHVDLEKNGFLIDSSLHLHSLVVPPLCYCPACGLVLVTGWFNKGSLILISGICFSSPKYLVYLQVMVLWSHRSFGDDPGATLGNV